MAPWQTIPELVDDAAARFGDADAFVDGDTRFDFVGFADAVHRSARAMIASGVGPGDRVAVWAPNTWEWAVAALGVHGAGGVLVPINTRFKGREAGLRARPGGRRHCCSASPTSSTPTTWRCSKPPVPAPDYARRS